MVLVNMDDSSHANILIVHSIYFGLIKLFFFTKYFFLPSINLLKVTKGFIHSKGHKIYVICLMWTYCGITAEC